MTSKRISLEEWQAHYAGDTPPIRLEPLTLEQAMAEGVTGADLAPGTSWFRMHRGDEYLATAVPADKLHVVRDASPLVLEALWQELTGGGQLPLRRVLKPRRQG